MGIGRTNAGGGGTGGKLTVNAPAGVTVTAEKDGRTYTRTANAQGVAVFSGLATGLWDVTISDGVQEPATQQVQITADYEMTIAFFAANIQVTYPAGSICTCTKGATVLTAPDTSGSVTFLVPEAGDWTVSCTDGTGTASQTVTITEDGQREIVSLGYQLYASDFDFYTDESLTVPAELGTDYEIVYDDDTAIPQELWASAQNWKIRCLATLYCVPLKDGEIDVFCVGGGGGTAHHSSQVSGAGGGYTNTALGISVLENVSYAVVIGSGGIVGTSMSANAGGDTSAFGVVASGGKASQGTNGGGNGGSGGGGGNSGAGREPGGGGSDGGDGEAGYRPSGKGQISTPGPNGETGNTREFGEDDARLYAGGGSASGSGKPGGDGGGGEENEDGSQNTGGGAGGGGNNKGASGGCGIVVFRNARGEAA